MERLLNAELHKFTQMLIQNIIKNLETLAPPVLQESYDNAGLIVGNAAWECSGVLVCLDALPAVIDEAIERQCNLVVAHHPIVFKGLKKINGKNYVEETIVKAIKNDVAIYAIHTNLDNIQNGVNAKIASMLGLQNTKILAPKTGMLQKLVVFVPISHKETVQDALFAAGAGEIGNYSECSFVLEGEGSFKPGNEAKPFTGEAGKRSVEKEVRLEVIFESWKKQNILAAMKGSHPYEEVAYYLSALENEFLETGSGMVGELRQPMKEMELLEKLRSTFGARMVRHTELLGKPVQKVAVCGGAGIFLLPNAISSGADVYVTADVKYHEFFDADGRILLADIGHYESEQFTTDLLVDHLRQNFLNFAVLKTGLNTNPVRYL